MLLGTLVGVAHSFIVVPATATRSIQTHLAIPTRLHSTTPDEENNVNEPPKKLVLDNLSDQMQKVGASSEFSTNEASYLAAARKRAELHKAGLLESRNNESTDAEWENMADENKKATGGQVEDAWEASLKEAGNADSQILMFTGPGEGEDAEDADAEQTLLL